MKLPPPITLGDTIYCRIKGSAIVSLNYKYWEAEIPFQLVGYDEFGGFFILLVPPYYNIKSSWEITENQIADNLGIDPKFKGRKAIAITKDSVSKIDSKKTHEDGMICDKCNKFIYMAGPNQSNGTFICYSCKNNPYKI